MVCVALCHTMLWHPTMICNARCNACDVIQRSTNILQNRIDATVIATQKHLHPDKVTRHRESTANLRTNDSGSQRVLLKHNIDIKGWNSHVHREFPGMLESSNLSRDDISREIRRTSRQGSATP